MQNSVYSDTSSRAKSVASESAATSYRSDVKPTRKDSELNCEDPPRTERQTSKLGVEWRRGNKYAWRDFKDEKLVDFKVNGSTININQSSFRGDDTWTEFKRTRICSGALRHLQYPYSKAQRDTGQRRYEKYDSDGNGIGKGEPIYEDIWEIRMPLAYVWFAIGHLLHLLSLPTV